jgi:hypothetical protein
MFLNYLYKIKLTAKNAEKINLLIQHVNKHQLDNVKHPATTAQLIAATREAEEYLRCFLGLSGYDCQGAKLFYFSKNETCARKKISMNFVVISRGARAWFVDTIEEIEAWNTGKSWTIQLTKEQDDLCIKHMRNGYTIEEPKQKPVFKI